MPIRWQVYPQSRPPSPLVRDIAKCFEDQIARIGTPPNKPESNDVLAAVRPGLERLGFKVEVGKGRADKVRVPILFGQNGVELKAFEVDAWSPVHKAVIEIEAGTAKDARKFYQDLIEAIAMPEVDFLCIAVQNAYHPKRLLTGQDDFAWARRVLDSLYATDRFRLPLSTVMLLGY